MNRYEESVKNNKKMLDVINESKANQYDELVKENENLKKERDEQQKWAEHYHKKYNEAWAALIRAENKNDKISKMRFFLALPFALIGYPFKFLATGWFKIANKIYGYDDFE